MKAPNAEAAARTLTAEGFRHVAVWRDPPGGAYPSHTHSNENAFIVLDGEISVTTAAGAKTYRPGDRCDIPAGKYHSALAGPQGCAYVTGER